MTYLLYRVLWYNIPYIANKDCNIDYWIKTFFMVKIKSRTLGHGGIKWKEYLY